MKDLRELKVAFQPPTTAYNEIRELTFTVVAIDQFFAESRAIKARNQNDKFVFSLNFSEFRLFLISKKSMDSNRASVYGCAARNMEHRTDNVGGTKPSLI